MEEKERIINFLDQTRHLLCFLVSIRRSFAPPSLDNDLMDSWKEIMEAIYAAQRQLMDVKEEQLRRIGFTGAQLRLKMGAFQIAWDGLHNELQRPENIEVNGWFTQSQKTPSSPGTMLPRPITAALRKIFELVLVVLGFVNSALESLAKVTGFAEVVKEFKEVLENLIHAKKTIGAQ